MKISRLLTNVCSTNLQASSEFYTSLFDFTVNYDSDWFVHLLSKDKQLEFGIIRHDHDIVPEAAKGAIVGAYVTFVVDDVDAFYEKVNKTAYEVLQSPEMTFYGQKRMLIRAPEGTVCDVSAVA